MGCRVAEGGQASFVRFGPERCTPYLREQGYRHVTIGLLSRTVPMYLRY